MKLHDIENLIISNEMFNPILFKKLYNVWRINHLKSRIMTVNKKVQLPWNSVLHILDNAGESQHLDTPRLELNDFYKNEKYKKFIFHDTNFSFDEQDPIQINTITGAPINQEINIEEEEIISTENIKNWLIETNDLIVSEEKILTAKKNFIFQKAGMQKNLLKFRSDNGSKFRYIQTIEEISPRRDVLNIVNHNPLFRVQTRGTLKYFKKIQLVLASILNLCCRISEKTHYICIPFSTNIYQRTLFVRTEKVLNAASIKKPENFHYIFMMNFLNFISRTASTSIFSLIPEDKRKNINFIIQLEDKFIIHNLHDIYAMNEKNVSYIKIINQLNSLALTGIIKEDKTKEFKHINDEVSEFLTDKQIEEHSEIDLTEQGIEIENRITDDTIEIKEIAVEPERDVIQIDEFKQDEEIEYKIKEIADKLDDIERVNFDLRPSTSISSNVTVVNEFKHDETDIKDIDLFAIDIADTITEPQFEMTPTYKREKTDLRYMDELDKQASIVIQNTVGLTEKQRERYMNLSKMYKKLTIEDIPFEEVLNGHIDNSLNDNKLDFLENEIVDKSMLKSRIVDLDNQYMQKSFKKDLVATCVSFAKNGMFLTDFKEEKIYNNLNRLTEYKVTYLDLKDKKHTTKFIYPEVDENGHCFVNGVNKMFKKQMVNVPICKISPTKVSLSSYYNKARVTKEVSKAHSFNEYILKLLHDPNITFELGKTEINLPLAYEYTSLASKLNFIKFTDLKQHNLFHLFFNYHNRFTNAKKDHRDSLIALEQAHGILFGKVGNNNYLFINNDNEVTKVNIQDNIIESYNSIIEIVSSGSNVKTTKLSEWINFEYMGKKYPIIFILGYKFGLSKILDYIGCSYELYPRETRTSVATNENVKSNRPKLKSTDLVIDFKDVKLVINRYPITQYLIVSGLKNYNLKDINFEEMNTEDPYFDLLLGKRISVNNLKGIDMFFELFIDPITRDILMDMNEPTNVRDLLIRAVVMLSTEYSFEASAMKNHRLRSYERFNAILYNNMARRLADVKNRPGRGMKFSVNPIQIYNEIITDQAMQTVDSINPIQDIKEKTNFTYVGMGGRTKDSFVINDRIFPKDAVGIISESTVDSGDVAINASLTADPNIINTKGKLVSKSIEQIEPTEALSATALLMPCSTNDDNARISFINIQLSHHVPTVQSDVSRIRTGFEKVVAQRCSDGFAGKARADGIIEEVNESAKMIKVVYKDKSIDIFKYGEEQNIINDGIAISHYIKSKVKTGDKVKKGDIICYNEEFFAEDPYSKQVNWKHGVNTNIALIETATTLEDSNLITTRLSEKLTMNPVEMSNPIRMDKNTIIHHIVEEGQHVQNTDFLMQFEDADFEGMGALASNEYMMSVLSKFGQHTPKAKHTGTVVKIEVFYSCPLNEMHPSLAKVVKDLNKLKVERNKFTKNTSLEKFNLAPQPLPGGTKYKGILIDPDTVIFVFYIRQHMTFGSGDKCVFGNQMKSVCCKTYDGEITSQSGVPIDALFSATSLSKRIVLSTQLVGIGNRILEKMEADVLKIYFGE